jgi:SAM-dependent methyltransferase
MERTRVGERDQEAEQRAELEIRLATAEHALAAHAESMGAVLRSLEERLRSVAATASVRLNDAEGALIRLQRHVDGEAGAAGRANGEGSADAGAAPDGHLLCAPARMDALFLEMSYAFRGSRDEIKGRVARHLPEVLAAVGQGGQLPILDIGCGRGEWLEVLRDAKVPARGVDTSQACVALCIDHGLSVTQADGLAALGETPDGALGGVSALHVVEHLPFDAVVRLIDEAHRCIARGGVLLLETPNPESLMVGGRTFFFDPTHRMPIPPDVLALVVRERGFTEVRVERLHPYPREYQLPGEAGEAERVLNQLLYGPQDYCIMARRP